MPILPCPKCSGSRMMGGRQCPTCNGEGLVLADENGKMLSVLTKPKPPLDPVATLGHLRALIANGCDAVDPDGLTESVGAPMCAYCEGKTPNQCNGGSEIVHEPDCPYVAAKTYVDSLIGETRSVSASTPDASR